MGYTPFPVSRPVPFACALCLLLRGCGGAEEEGLDLLAACGDGAECSSGLCIYPVHNVTDAYYCSQECSDSRPCPSVDGVQLVCADDLNSASVCSKPCAQGQLWQYMGQIMERACIDGTPTRCSALTAERASASCEACGCADGERCTATGCAPELATGDPCELDEDCGSQNCGVAGSDMTGTRACLVEIGAACTADDCASCGLYRQALCTKSCTADAHCPAGWSCIGSGSGSAFAGSCRPACYNGMPFGSDANCPMGFMCMLRDGVSWCDG